MPAGAPLGNQNAVKNKPYRDALNRVLAQLEIKDADGNVVVKAGEALRAMIEAQVTAAILKADSTAARDVADRLDGKPAQQVALTGADDGPIVLKISSEDGKVV